MADLGKSQARQVGNLGNSPAGATGQPLSSRGDSYRTTSGVPVAQNFTSRSISLNSTATPAGLPAPQPGAAGQHYAKLGTKQDVVAHTSRISAAASPEITPAGSGSLETPNTGHYYSAQNSKVDSLAARSGKSNALFGGKSGSTGMTQADTGALPIVTGGGPSVTTYFLMRGHDVDCVTQPTYRYWTVTGTPDTTGSHYGGTKCGASPLADIVVQQTWKQ